MAALTLCVDMSAQANGCDATHVSAGLVGRQFEPLADGARIIRLV